MIPLRYDMSQEVPQIDTFVCMPIRGLEPTDRHVDLLLTDSGPTSDQLTRGAPAFTKPRLVFDPKAMRQTSCNEKLQTWVLSEYAKKKKDEEVS